MKFLLTISKERLTKTIYKANNKMSNDNVSKASKHQAAKYDLQTLTNSLIN